MKNYLRPRSEIPITFTWKGFKRWLREAFAVVFCIAVFVIVLGFCSDSGGNDCSKAAAEGYDVPRECYTNNEP